MKKTVLFLFVLCFGLNLSAHKTDPVVTNPYEAYFTKAYELYPEIPRGVLEAVAYTNTRFNHIVHPAGEPESCSGIPKAYGIMGLTLDGKNYFNENLKKVASISGYSVDDIISSPEKNILAYAKALASNLKKYNLAGKDPFLMSSLIPLSELPFGTEAQTFAVNTQIYGILTFMNDTKMQTLYKFPTHNYDLLNLFGEENFKVLSAGRVIISEKSITDGKGNNFRSGNISVQSADYGPALWVSSPNYNSRGGTAITAVTIHDMEGSYAGAISWFQNTSSQVSAHYCIRSSDGQITQMVLEANRAWHVGSENNYTIGIEHEGYANQTGWYTVNMYTQSALLTAHICTTYNINPKRTLYQPWGNTTYYAQSGIPGACTKIKGHMHYPNQTHTDPGPNWDWDYYYKLVNSPSATVYSTAIGNFYDSGGPNGNYSNDEHLIWTISPAGATSVTLSFNNFDVENTWDYLYVYNGPDIWSPLVGYYSGTTNPGTLIASTGTMTIEFRSDCATTATGWNASWNSVQNTTGTNQLAGGGGQLLAYPNPFNEDISINYSLNENSSVKITLVDMIGREVSLFEHANQSAGMHHLKVDAKSLSLTQGVYFLKLESGNKTSFVKLIKN
ncbi:MAG TPA: N-acetylmuramoyl-L-alanine amidase [Bacteroidia bacterium]|jgi:N-acetyl-anhydromuramyl-L-alanine amidase AmpD|nr:N-acetylmuramoyl-L-alanine amidase [Bacteroidia bacterium]